MIHVSCRTPLAATDRWIEGPGIDLYDWTELLDFFSKAATGQHKELGISLSHVNRVEPDLIEVVRSWNPIGGVWGRPAEYTVVLCESSEEADAFYQAMLPLLPVDLHPPALDADKASTTGLTTSKL